MHNSAIVNIRLVPSFKMQAETMLNKIGLSSVEAISLFYKQVCLHRGLPFDVRILNKSTLKVIHDADVSNTHKTARVDAFFDNYFK